MSTRKHRVNEAIRARQVRLIGPDGKQVGVVPLMEALAMARQYGLDLVEVAPQADPPVCRIMDYGKFLYEQAKKEREARKALKQIVVKEIRLRPTTDPHHVGFKVRDARRFLNDGNKVKVQVRMRGREITHLQLATEMLQRFAEQVADVGMVEIPPSMEGQSMVMVLAPLRRKGGQPAERKVESSSEVIGGAQDSDPQGDR
ncbi:translation initiation factor IF-3 [Thermoflexus sp.]|uniref:translation initiation factor IF-3 n=1 Tax=Thermoflexus sp. TaxID=1969742 RepID=UPI0035E40680